MKITIKSITDTSRDWEETTELYCDGVLIGYGEYQGQPEDRSRCRDFDWVEPMLKKLAETLGADVEIVKVDKE